MIILPSQAIIIPSTAYWIIIYLWFPETANLTLEEVAVAFGDTVSLGSLSFTFLPSQDQVLKHLFS
jgi:hypothetical protein